VTARARLTAPEPLAAKADKIVQRALARVTGRAARLNDEIRDMQREAEPLALTLRIEVNNLMEVNDLLRHKLHEATLARVIHGPPQTSNPEEDTA
jgi:hypothetical protein